MRPSALVRAAGNALSALAVLAMLPVLALSLYYAVQEKQIADGGFLSDGMRAMKPVMTAEVPGAGQAGTKGGEPLSGDPLAELRELNPDICGWLSVDGTHIDYPVVRGEDDSYYLSRNYAGEESVSGAIFLSSGNRPDFRDGYSLIFGHHMDNGAMFGDVVRFLEEEYFSSHPGGTLVTGEERLAVRFFACVRTTETDSVIYSLSSGAEKVKEHSDALSGVHRPEVFKEEARVAAFSTCLAAGSEERAVLLGILE